ncbi:hypothetical protein BJ138DRAFT_1142091 [Hygrophoropsis aurantiaca]|uniref:Uncharacterized protein n=1 Tax=Hygrophoropsis aurantiaca TaxID=72124 RepID=A0ACB8AQ05_9AGAM|nr:hypothetical protein BJ138DRAFT_1142091 [Hygrophoropsis aurantiaca]
MMDSQPPPLPPTYPVSDIITTTWPRRAIKACASCRRDKIRCDGAKPCGGCLKKGYTVDQCVDGCEHCRRARVRCEGGKPCFRCQEMHLECAEEQTALIMRTDTSPPTTIRSNRPRPDRAKLACQNCRRDNKKCDDQRPCSRCVARGEDCVHVVRGPKLVKLRCESCRHENRRCEDARPCKQCLDQGKECVSVQRKGRGHGTRVKAACGNCRRDKVRCEGVRPCVTCVRKGYQCFDRVCQTCAQQGIEGNCIHHSTQDPSGSDGDDAHPAQDRSFNNAQPQASSSQNQLQVPVTTISYSSHAFNPTNFHVIPHDSLGAGPSGPYTMSHNPGYFPVIDPQINTEAPRNISSERFQLS